MFSGLFIAFDLEIWLHQWKKEVDWQGPPGLLDISVLAYPRSVMTTSIQETDTEVGRQDLCLYRLPNLVRCLDASLG